MARLSYGGDIFSPIASDVSLNASSFKEGSSKRGSILEDLPSSSTESSKSINPNSVELLENHRKNNRALPLKEVALRQNDKTKSKSSKGNKETIIIEPCMKDENNDSELPLKSLRRSKRAQKNKDEIAKKQIDSKDLNSSNKSSSSQTSKRRETDSRLKFITVRDGESKTKDVENGTKSPLVVAPPQSGKLDEEADSFKNSNEITVKDSANYEITKKVTTGESDLPLPSVCLILPSPIKEISKLDLKSSSAGDDSGSKTLQNIPSVSVNVSNDHGKIQTKMIEKLSDNVTAEFDRLRQEMYMMQISTLKMLNDRKEEFENAYSRDMEHLYKIIDALLEENRLLRTAILARQ